MTFNEGSAMAQKKDSTWPAKVREVVPQEINLVTGAPYKRSLQTRENMSAGLRKSWAKRRAKKREILKEKGLPVPRKLWKRKPKAALEVNIGGGSSHPRNLDMWDFSKVLQNKIGHFERTETVLLFVTEDEVIVLARRPN